MYFLCSCSPRAYHDQFHAEHTTLIAYNIGVEAAKRKIKAYIRVQNPYYDCAEKTKHPESAKLQPSGARGIWWHEALRLLASIKEYAEPNTLEFVWSSQIAAASTWLSCELAPRTDRIH